VEENYERSNYTVYARRREATEDSWKGEMYDKVSSKDILVWPGKRDNGARILERGVICRRLDMSRWEMLWDYWRPIGGRGIKM